MGASADRVREDTIDRGRELPTVVAAAQCQVNCGDGDDSLGAGDEVDTDLRRPWGCPPRWPAPRGPASHWAVVTRGMTHLGHHLESGKGESQLPTGRCPIERAHRPRQGAS